MRYALAVVFSFIAVTIAPAWAQQDQDRGRASRMELYGGYDYIRFNINASASVLQPPSETFNANGAGGQLVYNLNNSLGILGDLSGYWAGHSDFQNIPVNRSSRFYLLLPTTSQTRQQPRIPPLRPVVADSNGKRLLLPDQNDQLLSPRDPRIDQVALQEHVVLRGNRDHHCRGTPTPATCGW